MDLVTLILGGIGALLSGLVLWLARSGGKKDAALDEAARMKQRDDDQMRRINEAIAQRRDADEIATTAADVRADPSMRDRQRD